VKKISGKIAMILILVMLASSFTGCFSFIGGVLGVQALLIIGVVADLLIIALMAARLLGSLPGETGIYLTGTEYDPLAGYYSAMDILNSLPEEERASIMEKINSLPETKRADMFRTVNALPETEIASSIKRLNALSKTEFASAVQTFNALSEAEFDILADTLNERANSTLKTEYACTVAFSRKKAYTELCFQY
jgi:hypothetical protein